MPGSVPLHPPSGPSRPKPRSARITPESLMTLEAYAKARKEFRAKVIAHKKARTVHLAEHLTLQFEDELTMRYQIQEMLRAERIFESEAIAEELESYNPLIPDGTNLKATMMLEYDDAAQRRVALAELKGIEDAVYVEIGTHGRVFAYADEDIERSDESKTSAVHFLRFELDVAMRASLKAGAALRFGVDHELYRYEIEATTAVRASLAADID